MGYSFTILYTPTQLGKESDWVTVAAGSAYSMAIKSDGSRWGWGVNFYGQLGDNTITTKQVPTQTGTAIDGILSVARSGGSHVAAIKTNGTLWTWGYNLSGQLGNGNSYYSKFTPEQVGSEKTWVSAALGGGHTVLLKSNGTLWTCGSNSYSQLGLAATGDRNIPSQVGNDTNWTAIAAGSQHSLAIKSNGTLWAWGKNEDGQLGDGTTTISKSSPVQIGTDNKWVSIVAGTDHTIALKSDGTLCGHGAKIIMASWAIVLLQTKTHRNK